MSNAPAPQDVAAATRERRTMPDGRVFELEPCRDGSFNVLWVTTCPECKTTLTSPNGGEGHYSDCSRDTSTRTQ